MESSDVITLDYTDSEEEEEVRRKVSGEEKSDGEAFSGEEEGEDRQEEDGQRMTAFNMREEMEEGHFDTQGSFVWDKKQEEVRDHWADNVGSMKIAKRKKPIEQPEIEDAGLDPESLLDKYEKMLGYMKPQESVNEAIRRLAGSQSGLSTLERLKLKKEGKLESKHDLDVLTELSNEILLRAGNTDVYEMSYSDIAKKLEGRKREKAEVAMESADVQEKVEKPDLKRKSPSPLPEASLDMYDDDFAEKEKEKLEQPDAKRVKLDEDQAGSSQVIDLFDYEDNEPSKKTKTEAEKSANSCSYEEWEDFEKRYNELKATKAKKQGNKKLSTTTTDD